MTHAVETDREFKRKSALVSGNARRKGMLFLAGLMTAFTAYSWFGRPAFIWGPPIEPPPPAVQDANIRMTMFVFGMRLDKHKRANRAYPESLTELGDSVKGLSYQKLNDSTFELRGKAANHEVVFRNDMNAAEFLGNTKEVIQARRRR